MELATPAKFDVYDEPSNVAHRWERYVKSVKLYLTAKGINAAQRQRKILLHCPGSDVQDIADNNILDTGTHFTTFSTQWFPHNIAHSGASVNVLPLHVYQKVKQQGSKLLPTSTRIYPYGSSQPVETLGKCHVTVDAFDKRSLVEFVIVNHKGTTILGRDTSIATGVLHVGPPNHPTRGLYKLAPEQENTASTVHTNPPAYHLY